MENILFPYEEMRKTQDVFINDIIKTLENKKHLLAHVPTGVGKSCAVLSTTLPFALKNNLNIFFLTSKHTQHKIAIETLKQIQNKYKVKINVVDVIGKKWMCAQSNIDLLTQQQFHEYCRDAIEKRTCDFYNNIRTKGKLSVESKKFLEETKEQILHVEESTNMAKQSNICPYEAIMLKAKEANIIIADYYHIFSSSIRELFFKKTEKSLKNSIIIIDEAHNLPSRIRDLLTSNLSSITLKRAIKESNYYPQITEKLQIIENLLFSLKTEEEEHIVRKEEFKIDNYMETIEEFEIIADEIIETKKRSYIGVVANFLVAWLGSDEGFARIFSKSTTKDNKEILSLSYRCLDPSILTQEIISNSYCIVGMSGTLNPLEMYSDLLGFKDTILKQYPNPFPQSNRLTLIVPKTTTKYTKRSFGMFQEIAQNCAEIANIIPGNIAMFFPSYKLRDDVNVFFQTLCKKTTLFEVRGLNKKEREEILEKFKSYKKVGAVLLAVSSGSFGEGIDLPGDFLKAVIVVGLPLSKPDLETKELIKYYDEKFNKGWDYAYIFPAMQKAIQSAGRCIRSESDRGVIIFLDERYSLENYRRCFPEDMSLHVTKLPLKYVEEFFKKE